MDVKPTIPHFALASRSRKLISPVYRPHVHVRLIRKPCGPEDVSWIYRKISPGV